MKEYVTLWYRLDKKTNQYIYNHIEHGWASVGKMKCKPKPLFKTQQCWNQQTWRRDLVYLVNNKVTY